MTTTKTVCWHFDDSDAPSTLIPISYELITRKDVLDVSPEVRYTSNEVRLCRRNVFRSAEKHAIRLRSLERYVAKHHPRLRAPTRAAIALSRTLRAHAAGRRPAWGRARRLGP